MHIGLKDSPRGVLGSRRFRAPHSASWQWDRRCSFAAFVSTTITPQSGSQRSRVSFLNVDAQSGPLADAGRTIQFIVIGAFLGFFAMMVRARIFIVMVGRRASRGVRDRRRPSETGLGIAMLVVIQNRYAASTVRWRRARYWALRRSLQNCPTPERTPNVVTTGAGHYFTGQMFISVPGTLVLVFRILRRGKTTDVSRGLAEYRATGALPLVPYVW